MRRVSLLAGCLIVTECAAAGSLLDYLRDYDLNDYAIGVAVTGEQNPYSGSKNGAYAYPYLTSFRDSAFTDDWFLIREGDLGVRWLSKSGWELGAVGRIQTLGLGNTKLMTFLESQIGNGPLRSGQQSVGAVGQYTFTLRPTRRSRTGTRA